jgi:hypothetical protein
MEQATLSPKNSDCADTGVVTNPDSTDKMANIPLSSAHIPAMLSPVPSQAPDKIPDNSSRWSGFCSTQFLRRPSCRKNSDSLGIFKEECMRVLLILAVVFLASCSNYEVNTTERWCEHLLSEGNLAEKHAPFWAVFPSVSFDGNAIRDDFVHFLNEALMQKVQGRIDRMVWREGSDLHVENLSSLMEIDQEEVIAEWRKGIQRDNAGQLTDSADQCLYGTVTSMFDSVTIHSKHWDSMGFNVVSEDKTVLDTDRKKRIKNPL